MGTPVGRTTDPSTVSAAPYALQVVCARSQNVHIGRRAASPKRPENQPPRPRCRLAGSHPRAGRSPLDGDREPTLCIVGGGFTGLWTAYELKRADPTLEIVVLEREFADRRLEAKRWLAVVGLRRVAGRGGGHTRARCRAGDAARDAADRRRGDRRLRARGIDADIVKHGSCASPAIRPSTRGSPPPSPPSAAWDHGPDDLVELDAAGVAAPASTGP